MCDIFHQQDLLNLFYNKKVVFIGDSNVRASYKDILCLFHGPNIVSQQVLKTKMENSVFNDRLMSHGQKSNARDYREERMWKTDQYEISFYFVTQVYSAYFQQLITRLTEGRHPDVIIISSCLWDINRWGVNSVKLLKKNLVLLMNKFNAVLSKDCLVIWMTAPPVATEIQSGFLVNQLDFLKYSMRFHILEANTYARRVVVKHGYDVLDVHYHLRMQIHHRCPDGIHWDPEAMRYISNLLLTHIAVAWDMPLPHRNAVILGDSIDESKYTFYEPETENAVMPAPKVQNFDVGPSHSQMAYSHHNFAKRETKAKSYKKRRAWQRGGFASGVPYHVPEPQRFQFNYQQSHYTSSGRQSESLMYQYSFNHPSATSGPSFVGLHHFASPEGCNIIDFSAEGYSDSQLPEQLYGSENHGHWFNRRSRQHLPRHSQRELQSSGAASDALRNSEDIYQAYPQDYTSCDLPSTCMF